MTNPWLKSTPLDIAPTEPAPTEPAPTEAAPTEPAPTEAAPTATASTTPQRAVGSQPAPKAHALTKMHTTIKPRRTPNATTSGGLGIIGADALGWALLAMQSRQK